MTAISEKRVFKRKTWEKYNNLLKDSEQICESEKTDKNDKMDEE